MATRQNSTNGKPKSPRIQVVLPESLCEELTSLANEESRTVSNMAKVLIQRGIKAHFSKERFVSPPKLDPETGMHPEYGKQAARYRKLDPHSADAMPETGDPEIDAEVMKQKSGKKKKKLSDFKRNIK